MCVSFHRGVEHAGMPKVRPHDLRHTAATRLLGARVNPLVNPKVVSELLGQSAISITRDSYAHVLPAMQHDAATTMQGLLLPRA